MLPPFDQTHIIEEPRSHPLGIAIEKAQTLMLGLQAPDGYWWYSLQANETIGSGAIMLAQFLDCVDPAIEAGLCRRLLDEQHSDGSWNLYHGADGDLSATVEAYLALRLAGYPLAHEALTRARQFILANGGLTQIRIFSRIHLALFGLVPWEGCPSLPPWLIFMPLWTRFSIYEFSSWARASIVPLILLMEQKPVQPVSFNLNELAEHELTAEDWKLKAKHPGFNWETLFIAADHILKLLEKLPWHPGKAQALKACERWVRDHLKRTEDIYPALAYSAMGLGATAYPCDDPELSKALAALKRFQQIYVGELPPDGDPISLSHPIAGHPANETLAHPVDSDTIRIHQQCCISPMWDTPWNVSALLASGLPGNHPALKKATQYLLDKQISTFRGDWSVKNFKAPAGGWAFEFENDFFPDVDDTIQIINILRDVELPDIENKLAIGRGLAWLYSMQSKNGGWAAFDVDNTTDWVNRIPFSDHGACQDPPTADITGRMVGLLADFGVKQCDPVVQKALTFIEQDQLIAENTSLEDSKRGIHWNKSIRSPARRYGAWWGRWGVNYTYGTWCVLKGLAKIGLPSELPMIQRAVNWLEAIQLPDGSWGESCLGYKVNHFVPLENGVPSQTAWALMALIASGKCRSNSVKRGIDYLLMRQRPDGGWDEAEHTGTGFPGYFYLRYHGYRHYFPLMALGEYQKALNER